jgi:uncharacterized alpha-E superfamily protein
MISSSTAPSLVDGRIEPRHAILRAFLVDGRDGYLAMPGGLTRIAPDQGELVVSNKSGGGSKDTWVLSREPVRYVSLWRQPPREQVLPFRAEPLPSRAADNLFWSGRYVERAEGPARLLRAILALRREQRDADRALMVPYQHSLLRALTHVTSTYPGFVGKGAKALLANPRSELHSLLQDVDRVGSLASVLQSFSQVAMTVRDHWPIEIWRIIEGIKLDWFDDDAPGPTNYRMQDRLDHLIMQLVAFSGLAAESIPREAGWLLLELGRRLERGLGLIALLRATLVSRLDEAVQRQLLETVLTICDSLNTFRRRYRSYMHLPTVLDLLLMDREHPRSLAYQLDQLQRHIDALPHDRQHERLGEDQRCILEIYSRLRLAEVGKLAQLDEDEESCLALDALLEQEEEGLWRLSEIITGVYFSHAQTPRQLTPQLQDEDL